jgi:hypothetical protein
MNSQLDSIMIKPQLRKKYKGAKRMVVELERLDISKYRDKSIFNVQSHYCQYFKTRGSLNDKCIHRKDDHISQSICLNCDYKIEHQESLNHMAFESPVKKIQEQLEMPVFFSPTVLNDEEESEDTTTLKNEEESLVKISRATESSSASTESEPLPVTGPSTVSGTSIGEPVETLSSTPQEIGSSMEEDSVNHSPFIGSAM